MNYLKPSVLSLCLMVMATSCIVDKEMPETTSEASSSSTAVLSSVTRFVPVQPSSQTSSLVLSSSSLTVTQGSSSSTPPIPPSSSAITAPTMQSSQSVPLSSGSSPIALNSSSSRDISRHSSSAANVALSNPIELFTSSTLSSAANQLTRYSSSPRPEICLANYDPVCAYDPIYDTIDTLTTYQLASNACVARQDGLKITEKKHCNAIYNCPTLMIQDVEQCEDGYTLKARENEWGCPTRKLCEKTDPHRSILVLDSIIPMKVGDTVATNDDTVLLTLDSIKDDRCPKEARCTLAGNARLSFTLTQGKLTESFDLNTDRTMDTFKPVLDYIILLKNVFPYNPNLDKTLPIDYTVSISVVYDPVPVR